MQRSAAAQRGCNAEPSCEQLQRLGATTGTETADGQRAETDDGTQCHGQQKDESDIGPDEDSHSDTEMRVDVAVFEGQEAYPLAPFSHHDCAPLIRGMIQP